MLGFALGWSMLGVVSNRFTDQPQRWTAVPAVFMALGGLVLLTFGSAAHDVLKWVWPPALLVLVLWMFMRSRRELRGKARWLLHPVFAALLVASLGGAYETLGEAADITYPMTGALVDLGDHSLHLRCTGAGTPTVILEPGAGEMSAALGWIEPAVARESKVCVYDRAGRGSSEPAGVPQDAAALAADLHTLLERGDVTRPYLLVGHSFGGLYMLTFAAFYPEEVVGMVLVDSAAPASTTTVDTSESGSYELLGHISALASSTARLGVGRLLGQSDYASLPPQSRDEARASVSTSTHIKGTIEEYLTANASRYQAAGLADLDGKPLVILTAGLGSSPTWMSNQARLATLSPNSAHRIIEGATHASLLHNQQHAARTTQAILDVVSSVRDDTQLVGS